MATKWQQFLPASPSRGRRGEAKNENPPNRSPTKLPAGLVWMRIPALGLLMQPLRRKVFGVVAVCEENGSIQAQTPGSRDVLVFEERAAKARRPGAVAHFGFRLVDAEDIDSALRAVKAAGGEVLSHGEFCPGEPYLFCRDPDGYEVEIWSELCTPVDPPKA